MAQWLVLIGFMGAGKSTVAARARRGARRGARSTATRCSKSASAIRSREEFELHGEAAFRAAEEELVCELLATPGRASVIALGGGSVLSERVRAALAPHLTVLLDVDAATAWERVQRRGGRRPSGRWRATARRSSRCTPSARRCMRSSPTRSAGLPRAWRDARGALRALSAAPAARACCGRARPRATTPCWSARPAARRRALGECGRSTRRARARSASATRPSPRCTRERLGELAGDRSRSRPGERAQDARERRARVARAGRAPA